MSEGVGGSIEAEALYEIIYFAPNAAKTPIPIALNIRKEWAEALVLAHNTLPLDQQATIDRLEAEKADLLEALEKTSKHIHAIEAYVRKGYAPTIGQMGKLYRLADENQAAIAQARP